jgi:hypothetical protein
MVPVFTGAVWWFSQAASRSKGTSKTVRKLYTSFKLNIRAASLYLIMWTVQVASLFPTCALGLGAYYIIIVFGQNQEMVFLAFQMIVFAVLGLGLYVRTSLSMLLAPFVFVKYPLINPFKAVSDSILLMRGKKMKAVKLLMSYTLLLVSMVFVVTIPFIIPILMMSFAVFA